MQVSVFANACYFHPSLIFVAKAGAYLCGASCASSMAGTK
jgi:hypothetical protein